VDLIEGALSFVADPNAAFAAAEAKLTKALSSVRDHALGHGQRIGGFTGLTSQGVDLGRPLRTCAQSRISPDLQLPAPKLSSACPDWALCNMSLQFATPAISCQRTRL
jgi:hypothetical protein